MHRPAAVRVLVLLPDGTRCPRKACTDLLLIEMGDKTLPLLIAFTCTEATAYMSWFVILDA